VTACPLGAVAVALDAEGFYTAKVDNALCTSCGLCKTVCLRAGVKNANRLDSGVMTAAQSTDAAVVRSCTSGGIACEMTRCALEKGMAVAGVVYDYTADRCRTVVVHTPAEAYAFRGSKYLQSDSSFAFAQLVHEAAEDDDRRFLAFGTPCQIYGLASLLEKEKMRDRFILVDLFCHGVPSYLVWDRYLDNLKDRTGPLNRVAFRDKTIGWHNFVMDIAGEKGDYKEASEGDLYYHAFFDNVLFSKACFDCEVRKTVSKADIRLGDYWGKRYQDREDGVSAVLTLTPAGCAFFAETPGIRRLEETPVEEMLQAQSVHTYKTVALREKAIVELRDTGNLSATIHHYRRNFSVGKRAKLALKEFTAHLPDAVRSKLRVIYKRL